MLRDLTCSVALAAILIWPALAQESGKHDDNFDVRSTVGDLHVGKDADARKAGLPLYPGAQPKREKDNDPLNFGVLTESFGLKLVIAKYETQDAPAKVVAFYRDKLQKYGKVLECHTREHGTSAEIHDDKDASDKHASKELKCEGNNEGPVTELKAGTEDNERVVAIEPKENGGGSTFALVYFHSRGRQGDL